MLNGSIIASVDDETAIFYNPGAMGLSDNFGLSLSLISPTFSYLNTSNFLGRGTSFSDKGVNLAPGMAAAMFKPFKTDKITAGVTTFTRFKSNVNFEDRVLKSIDDQSIFLGDVEFNRKINETWIGFALAWKIHERLGLGVTQFFTFRSENLHLNFKKEILRQNDPTNLIAGWRSDFEYGYSTNGAMLNKIGISWQPFSVKLGVTLTTQSYGLIHKDAHYEFDDQKILAGQFNTGNSNDRGVQLHDYRTPYSIGVGLEIPIDGSVLSISGEYFEQIQAYSLINDTDDPFDGLAENVDPTTVQISEAKDQVINVAIGFERQLDSIYKIFYGFRTDFSPNNILEINEGISFLASSPSIYHLSGGVAYSYRKSQFSVGLDYGFGFISGGEQLTDISDVTVDNIFTFSGEGNVNTWVHQVALYITYNL